MLGRVDCICHGLYCKLTVSLIFQPRNNLSCNEKKVDTTRSIRHNEYLPLKELRVVPMNTAIAPAVSSLTDSIMRFVSKDSWVRTQIPPVNFRDVSIDLVVIVNFDRERSPTSGPISYLCT